MTTNIISYKIFDFTGITEGTFATLDAVANITSQLTSNDLTFGSDWFLDEVYYNELGEQVINIRFTDKQVAMLVKLKGLQKYNGGII